jgi:hypothetical protein
MSGALLVSETRVSTSFAGRSTGYDTARVEQCACGENDARVR